MWEQSTAHLLLPCLHFIDEWSSIPDPMLVLGPTISCSLNHAGVLQHLRASLQPNPISPIFFSHTAPLDLCQKQPWHWSDCGAFSGRGWQHTQEHQQLQERDEGFRNHRWARQAAVWTLEWRQRHILEVKTLVEPVVLPAWIPLSRVCIGSLLGWTCFNRANYFTTDC
jgi:hypothetical protein